MKHRPVILILPERAPEQAPERGVFPRYVLREAYVEAVLEAGGLPLILPYLDALGTTGEDWLAALPPFDGLLCAGDPLDLEPATYGEAALPPPAVINGPCVARGRFELPLIRAVLRAGKPFLGICGGMQSLNVALGGTLWQDLPAQRPGAASHQQDTDRRLPHHTVRVVPGTRFSAIAGREQIAVNSTHHQAVKDLAPGLRVSGLAGEGEGEGVEVVEVIERGGGASFASLFAVGVQWHPELLTGEPGETSARLYAAFVEACHER